MYRSSSATMFRSDEHLLSVSSLVKSTQPLDDNLPIYDPSSPDGTKKEHYKSSKENAIHLIPLVLLLCGFVLWFFSHPTSEGTQRN
ncbi:hypothetical protein Hdeb2414_s0010g00356481 [Helianthus debilis subsp. tardiflorus]